MNTREKNKTPKEIQNKNMKMRKIKLKFNNMVNSKVIFRNIKLMFIGLIIGLVNGLFGSGGGTVAVLAMVLLLKEDEHAAHATAISIILPLTLLSAYFYMRGGYIKWGLAVNVMLGGSLGGYIGAKMLNFCPAHILRKIFAVFMLLAGIKLVLA